MARSTSEHLEPAQEVDLQAELASSHIADLRRRKREEVMPIITKRVHDYIARRGAVTRRELSRQLNDVPRIEMDAILARGVEHGDFTVERRRLNPEGGRPSSIYSACHRNDDVATQPTEAPRVAELEEATNRWMDTQTDPRIKIAFAFVLFIEMGRKLAAADPSIAEQFASLPDAGQIFDRFWKSTPDDVRSFCLTTARIANAAADTNITFKEFRIEHMGPVSS